MKTNQPIHLSPDVARLLRTYRERVDILERAELLDRAKVAHEKAHPETRKGGRPGRPGGGKEAAKNGTVPVFALVAARFLRVSRSSIDKDLRIAGLPQSVRNALHGTPLALRQRALHGLAQLDDPARQQELLGAYVPGRERAFLCALRAARQTAPRPLSKTTTREQAILEYRRACARLAELGVSRREAEEPSSPPLTKETVMALLRRRYDGSEDESQRAEDSLRALLRDAHPHEVEVFLIGADETYFDEPEGESAALDEDIEEVLEAARNPVSIERARAECAAAATRVEDAKVRQLIEDIAEEVDERLDAADLRCVLEEIGHVMATGERFELQRNKVRILVSVLADQVMSLHQLRTALKDRGHPALEFEYILKAQMPPFERVPGSPDRFRVQPGAVLGPYGWVRGTANTIGPLITVADVVELEALDTPEREREQRYKERSLQRECARCESRSDDPMLARAPSPESAPASP